MAREHPRTNDYKVGRQIVERYNSGGIMKLLIIFASVLPAAWVYGVAVQYQWIHQRCGSTELLARNAKLCADNALRMTLGGPLMVFVFWLLLALFLLPFFFHLRQRLYVAGWRLALAFQLFFGGALVFIPHFCTEQVILAVALSYLLALVLLLKRQFSELLAVLFPDRAEVSVSRNSVQPFFRNLFVGALLIHFALALVGFFHPITDHHSFRQTQTALSAYWMVQEGFRIAYETPMFGKPWSIPMEFPLYQYLSALIAKVTGLSLEPVGRFLSIFSFYGVIAFVALLLRRLLVPANTRYLALALLLLTPLHIYYSRTFLIETFSLLLGFAWLYGSLSFLEKRQLRWLLFASVVGVACALSKATTFAVFAVFHGGLFWFFRDKPFRENFRPKAVLFWFFAAVFLVLLPFAAGSYWVRLADSIKLQNPFMGPQWTSVALQQWNFGSLEQRVSFSYWKALFFSNLNGILGYFGLPILILLLRNMFRRSGKISWSWLFFLVFWPGPLIFANLYYIHDYYYVACAAFLVIALGLEIGRVYENGGGLTQKSMRKYVLFPVFLSMLLGYIGEYLPKQLDKRQLEAETLGRYVHGHTRDGEVVIALGYASPEFPYFSRRKMLVEATGDVRQDASNMVRALRELTDERIGAVVMPTQWDKLNQEKVVRLFHSTADTRLLKIETVAGYDIYKNQ